MFNDIEKLYKSALKNERLIIGLMSGTSCDGLDIALCKINGSGLETKINLLAFETVGYDNEFKELIHSVFSKKNVDLERLTLLNPYVAQLHAKMINEFLEKHKINKDTIDCIASHGQTIYHAPKILHGQQNFGNATLQIGDGDHLAVYTGIITISDFRQKHIAAGGEGAPLAVYGDFLIFGSRDENRIMLNIGGIANFTYLPKTMNSSKVFSTDVGPGNTIMDAYMRSIDVEKHFDENAELALQGNCNDDLLQALKQNDFFTKEFPKTTGPELFNLKYLTTAQQISQTENLSSADVMNTLNAFTVWGITEAIKRTQLSEATIYASGGGMHNPLLMERIKKELPNFILKTTNELEINPDAKEAVLFALLANECIAGKKYEFGNTERGIPEISMGKISFVG